jgi:hypothetical protein
MPWTPLAHRLSDALDQEFLRMSNEWFFKWHFIGKDGPIEIESFAGKPIHYGGIKFSGSAHQVYWDTIQRYLKLKIGSIFTEVEGDLKKYPIKIRESSLEQVGGVVKGFAARIRRAAIEKDRILRGNGFEFPPENDMGTWSGCSNNEIDRRVAMLKEIYCDPTNEQGVPMTNVFHGDGGRVNINSTDNSVTIINKDSAKLFQDLRTAIVGGIADEAKRNEVLESVTAMEAGTKDGTFSEKYRQFVATVADHISIVAPFLGALAQVLTRT